MARHDGPIVETTRLRVPGRQRQLRIAVLVLVGVLGVGALMVYLLLPREQPYVLRVFEEALVSRHELVQTVEASGAVVTLTERDVASPEAATVSAVTVSVGDHVRTGDALAVLSSRELEQELVDERALVRRAEREIRREEVERVYQERGSSLKLDRLEREHRDAVRSQERVASLVALGAQAAGDLEDARAATARAAEALESERLQVESAVALARIRAESLESERHEAEERIVRLEDRLASLVVRSPIEGSVVAVSVGVGERLVAHSLVAAVADTEHPSVELRVPESQASRVKPGQAVALKVATRALGGIVESVGLRAQGASASQAATVAVQVALTSPPTDLIAGSSVTAEIGVGVKTDALTLPRGPWLGSGEARYVYRVEGEWARRVPASFGATRGMDVEVLSGLEEGDRVLVSGYQEFRDRAAVRLAPGS